MQSSQEGGDNKVPPPYHKRSLPSQLYWRSVLGPPVTWSGSSARGVYVMDDTTTTSTTSDNNYDVSSKIHIVTDRRMMHIPRSLRDVVVQNLLSSDCNTSTSNSRSKHRRKGQQDTASSKEYFQSTRMKLLSHPRIVGSVPTNSGSTTFFSVVERASNGIACMDLDHGNDGTLAGSPPRYLLVGSDGGDCTIGLYDLSYFGSDAYLYQQQQKQQSTLYKNNISSERIHSQSSQSHNNASVTHRPIARSLRQGNNSTSASASTDDASGVPSGHRQPLLGLHWYPGDVRGAFVSASISGEILVWDAQNFVPVYATYASIYTGIVTNNVDDDGKTVAPLQCMDAPKTPESCPFGNALIALGLGGNGKGVIKLCDAFRGGGATHELVGHGTSGGGVNAVQWDPYHPFRLASGGDDCTVRLWDIRKAGAAACLGVLNRENEMYSGGGYMDNDLMQPPRKKQRASISTANHTGVESHGGPVTALTFAPGGDDLISAGLDGRIHHWDLRPDSCFVSSIAAISGNNRTNGMDPFVATGGRLYPTSFTSGGNYKRAGVSKISSPTKRYRSRHNKALLAILQPGSRSTTILLSNINNNSNSSKGEITGYSLFGGKGIEPGCAEFALSGHLSDVTCLVPIAGGLWDNLAVSGNGKSCNTVRFLTGGKDGMVLPWGHSRRRQHDISSSTYHQHDNNDDADNQSPPEILEEDMDNW